jgi:aryl-alcohol dehydrogenase-like predicted oxidoreductase
MQYKTLGDTGLIVSALCLGTMTFDGGEGFWRMIGTVGQTDADALVKGSIDAGVNFFDTADVYSEGESEKTLGQSLKNLGIARKDVVIATKVYSRTGPGRNDVGASRGHIMDAVEASLKRLSTDHIDLYQIHGNDAITPIEETLRALDSLVQQGKVRYIGASNWEAWKLARAITISEFKGYARFETLQAYYSIAGRDLEREFAPMFRHTKTGLLAWSPLAGGLLSGKFSRDNQKPENSRRSEFDFPLVDKERAWRILDVIRPIGVAHGCSPARIALAWLLHQPAVTSVLIGAKRTDQLKDNLASVDVKLSREELQQLDQISQLPPEYPGWMLSVQGASRL